MMKKNKGKFCFFESRLYKLVEGRRKKFKEHEKSHFYLEAVNEMAALNSKPINALPSDLKAKEQNTARTVLELAFRSVKFLPREGLPMRGWSHVLAAYA